MSWPQSTIVTHADAGDGQFVPHCTGGSDIAVEFGDGPIDEQPTRQLGVGLIGPTFTCELSMNDCSAMTMITNTRVVVTCRRLESKGGGRIGFGRGAAFALVANVVSKARVAARGAGKRAIGHVRHEWISFLGWKTKATGASTDEVRIGFRAPPDHSVTSALDGRVPVDLDPASVAVETMCRVARHRLAGGCANQYDIRHRCVEVKGSNVSAPTRTGFSITRIPDLTTSRQKWPLTDPNRKMKPPTTPPRSTA